MGSIIYFLISIRYHAFIPANPKQVEFVRYANSALTNQGHGGLVSSLSENMFKAVLVEKINNFLESEDYVSRVGTTASIPRRIIASVRSFFLCVDHSQFNYFNRVYLPLRQTSPHFSYPAKFAGTTPSDLYSRYFDLIALPSVSCP